MDLYLALFSLSLYRSIALALVSRSCCISACRFVSSCSADFRADSASSKLLLPSGYELSAGLLSFRLSSTNQLLGDFLSLLTYAGLANCALLALRFQVSLCPCLRERLLDGELFFELSRDRELLLALPGCDLSSDLFEFIGRNFLTARWAALKPEMNMR